MAPREGDKMDSDDNDLLSVGSEDPSTLAEHELPPMEDRKLFLTCLACLLASSYKYDVVEAEPANEEPKTEGNDAVNTSTDTAATAESNTPDNTPVKSDDGLRGTENLSSSDDDEDSPNEDGVANSTKTDISMFLEDEEEDTAPAMNDGSSNSHSNKDNGNKTPETNNRLGSRWRNRFGRGKKSASNISDSADDNSNHGSLRENTSRRMNSGKDASRRRKRISKAQQKLQLAAKRHKRRRHIVAEQCLQSSCELLLLDEGLAKEFYEELQPTLEGLQTPRTVPAGSLMAPRRGLLRKRWASGANDGSGSEGSNSEGSDSDDNSTGDNAEDAEREAREKQIQQQYLKQYEWMTEFDPDLGSHLPGLPPGAGYRCLCWLLFQHLLNASKRGYDARVRYAFKSLAVAVLVQDIERTLGHDGDDYQAWKLKNYTTWVSFATRKFEQVEEAMASRLLKLARSSANDLNTIDVSNSGEGAVTVEDLEEEAEDDVQVITVKKNQKRLEGARKSVIRGLKIGGVGVVAGTLLAVTGGLAVPAVAGALTFLGMGAVAGTFLTLASTSAVVHLFGVAGGSLAAYKMRRRTAGLTEFKIVQSSSTAVKDDDNSESNKPDMLPETKPADTDVKHPRLARWKEKAKNFKNRHTAQKNEDGPSLPTKAELNRTVCISGWLTDRNDFQRPWGITPTDPPASKLEKLQRFYRVYNPDLIPVCENLLKRWKKEENTFWELLEDKYGCNPDTLFPLRFGPMYDAALTEMEVKVLDSIIVEIGEVRGKQKAEKHAHLPDHVQSTIVDTPKDFMKERTSEFTSDQIDDAASLVSFSEEKHGEKKEAEEKKETPRFQRLCYASVFEQVAPSSSLEKLIPPSHLATVWDFSSRYGGEVYSLRWETHMLLKLCQCFRDVALQATASAGQQALKFMVANTLALWASVPIYVVQAMNSIDETWSVVADRAEEAGQELARSLLINNAGHRPVTLLGYSFGARVVFACLKQLLVYQQQWEEYHEQKNARALGFAQQEEGGKKPNRKEKKWMLEELEFEREPASVVEDVILMGAPMYLSLSSWAACRQVVAGRLVNVYSRTDKILSLMFKYKSLSMNSFKPVCGNCTVAVPGVENIDISDLVSNHQEYVLRLGDILKRVRHGQPIRSSSNALDEVALIAEATTIAEQQSLQKEDAGDGQDEPTTTSGK